MEAIIGIIDASENYAGHLAAYINSRRDVGYKGIIFKQNSEIHDFLKSKSLSLLLTDNPNHVITFGNKTRVCLMSDDRDECEAADDKTAVVFKYLKASSLLSSVIPSLNTKREKGNLHVVFAPYSNKEASLFAASLAEKFGKESKTLMVPWEPFGNYGKNPEKLGTTVSELLFSIRQNGRGLGKAFMGLPEKNGYSYFCSTDCYSDLWQFSGKEMEKLVHILKDAGGFAHIVFICGFISESIEKLMEMADEVWLVKQDEDDERAEEFMRQMKWAGKQDILSAVREVVYDGRT